MENRGFYVIDGSRLFASIHEIWRTKPEFNKKKLDIGLLSEAFMRRWATYLGPTVRITYYFKKGDRRIKNMLKIPESHIPGQKEHWQIKECGESLKSIPEEELQKIAAQYRDHFVRAEKGLDTQLTCDVLVLVANKRASNIAFLVNDRDYIPLFEAVQYLGGNVYLTAIDSDQNIQRGLTDLCDKYLTLDHELKNIFGIKDKPKTQESPLEQK